MIRHVHLMSEQSRPYHMRKRAEAKEETRRRIVEAAMALHEEIGPRAATISAIAEKAGVQRLTVYRHFADETEIFHACTTHWLDLNPLPDPATWAQIDDPADRFRAAIAAFYAYYSGTRQMWEKSYRDMAEVPALQQPMAEVATFMETVGTGLAAAFDPGGPDPRILATVRHVLHFQTWSELKEQGLDQEAKVGLATSWVQGARCNANRYFWTDSKQFRART